jgi:hypothetical protein
MPVVINEFEAVTAPAAPASSSAGGADSGPASKPDPYALARAMRRSARRLIRVKAH